jgi:hypothetical protein
LTPIRFADDRLMPACQGIDVLMIPALMLPVSAMQRRRLRLGATTNHFALQQKPLEK